MIFIVLNIIVSVVIFIIDRAVLHNLSIVGYVNLILVALVFWQVFGGLRSSLLAFVVCGWLLDIFTFKALGINTLALCLVFGAVYFLLLNFVTNRSLYSFLLLIAVATVIFDVVISGLAGADRLIAWSFWLAEGKRLAANAVLTAVFFYLFNFLSRRIQPVFLRDVKKY